MRLTCARLLVDVDDAHERQGSWRVGGATMLRHASSSTVWRGLPEAGLIPDVTTEASLQSCLAQDGGGRRRWESMHRGENKKEDIKLGFV
jgi:hypothetical protein